MNFGAHLFRAYRPSSIRSLTTSVNGVPAPFVYTAAASRHARPLSTTTTTTTTTTTSASPPPPPASTSPSSSSSEPTHTQSTSNQHQQPPAPTPTKSTPLPPQTSRKYGTVVSTGHMNKVVRVQYNSFQFDKQLNKNFPHQKIFLVSDPNNSLREGDVIEFWSGWRTSSNVRHVVERIMTPFGAAIGERPPVMSFKERVEQRVQKRMEKRARRERVAEEKAEEKGEVNVKKFRAGEEVLDENGLRMGKVKRLVRERLERERVRVEKVKAEEEAMTEEQEEGSG